MFNILFASFLCIIHNLSLFSAYSIAILYDCSSIFTHFQFFSSANRRKNSLLNVFLFVYFFLTNDGILFILNIKQCTHFIFGRTTYDE